MTELLEEGVVLMAIGMGTVFLLLTLLVFVVRAMSRISRALAPATGLAAPDTPSPRSDTDEEIVSVVSAAIRMHRRRRGDKS